MEISKHSGSDTPLPKISMLLQTAVELPASAVRKTLILGLHPFESKKLKMFEPKKNKTSSSLRSEHAIKAEALWSKVQSWYLCQATHLETQGFFRNKKRTCTTGSTSRCCWQALETPWKAPKDNNFDITKKTTIIFNVFRCVSYHFNIMLHPIELISKCESYTNFLHRYDWIVKIPQAFRPSKVNVGRLSHFPLAMGSP